MTDNKLTPKQDRFVAEYIANGMNATRAAISAGYSAKTANEQGSRLLANVSVAAVVDAKKAKILGKLEITAEKVLQEIAKIAFLDPRKLFASDGSLIPIHELDDNTAASIAGLEVNEMFEGQGDQKHAFGLCKKIKIADKGQNLERLGRYLKLFTDKTEIAGKDGGPIQSEHRIVFVDHAGAMLMKSMGQESK
ncbi:terminase small subunit [Edaphobacter aggregans]|uniref:terminase small subunit n=1 Tax=Edaphobacter aggregans TaxID=570835 RepID=UPI0005585203|nr:terminase small subunit [Edaphobacter aggregans]